MVDITEDWLKSIDGHLRVIRDLLSKAVNAQVDAEQEVPEYMRRFIMYMHDIHDVKNFYTEHGLAPPAYVMREAERCDDRLRQLLEKLHSDGETFEKVRREMAKDPANRWDHTRALTHEKD